MSTKKVFGISIIGTAITLAIAFLPLLIAGDYPITGTSASAPYNNQLSGDKLFKFILFIGFSIVVIFLLKDSKKIYKSICYPTLIGIICAIILGLSFPIRVYGWTRGNVFDFNTTIFFIILGIGVFISLMSIGINLLRK